METNTKTAGNNKVENNAIVTGEVVTNNKRKYSPAYMLNNYKTLIKNLDETEMLDEEDKKQLKELGQKMVKKFISINMFD